MPINFIGNLIRYIISEVQDKNEIIQRTRLVKLLYLCDVESYRINRRLITNFDWIRYYYGPYTFQLSKETRRLGFDIGEEFLDYSTGKGFKYEVYEVPRWETWLSATQKLFVDKVINRWGDEDLNLLLDYVYCYTEPMKNAQFNGKLDFNKIRSGLRSSETDSIKIPEKDITLLKQLIDKEGLISRIPLTINLEPIGSQKSSDEPQTPFISGGIKFTDTNTIRSFESME